MVVPLEALLARTDDIVVSLNGARVYSGGVELSIQVHARASAPVTALGALSSYGPCTRDQCLLGVEFPGGGTATNISDRGAAQTNSGPLLSSGGGGGGSAHSSYTFQLSPIPPAGVMAIWVAWPAASIPETCVEIATEPLREAADRVQVLWPEEPSSAWTSAPAERPELPPGGWFAKAVG
ncbi:hypothetical protein [Nocardia sp. NPDC057668]|uniref:hypothetical protein n=1 Tax=Nocardia sp. NPDC057668 TaxID=3346202 RepID=UPI00366BD6FD